VVSKVNFANDRIKPSLIIGASVGADLYKKENRSLRLQADVENISNRLDVIDFGGLFSGNAIGPPRSYFLRLTATF
jgi:outer membrane receptor for Fe3+-dicitrate